MLLQVGGFQGCSRDKHRNNWCCAKIPLRGTQTNQLNMLHLGMFAFLHTLHINRREFSFLPPPTLVLPHPLSFPREWGGGPSPTQKFSLPLTMLLWQNHHPRVLPKAFQWKVVSVCKSSRSSGAGPRKFTPSWSRSRSPYIGSHLNVSYAEFFRFMLQFLRLQMCVYGGSAVPQRGVGDCHLVTVPQGWWGTGGG